MAVTVASNITPGKNVIQYAPDKIKSKPFEINDPKDGSVIGTPTPRKLSVASMEIECAVCSVAKTIRGEILLGKRCFTIILKLFRPNVEAASIYYFLRSTIAVALTVRAYKAH